jgi:predicted nucleic-acid-binding Zn-ribbon protein
VEPRGADQDPLQKFEDWLVQKGIDLKCPVCGGGTFYAEGMIEGAEVISDPEGLSSTDRATAMVLTTCENCTYVMLFNAARMGILD